jgi:triacylglycerol lipase
LQSGINSPNLARVTGYWKKAIPRFEEVAKMRSPVSAPKPLAASSPAPRAVALFALASLCACGGPPDRAVSEEGLRSPAAVSGGLTSDFRAWLAASSYSGDGFARDDLGGMGSYGGRASAGQVLLHDPVIFIHGNADCALCTESATQTGWNASVAWFLSQGYTSAELYATTWGSASVLDTAYNYHSKDFVMSTRRFLQAVMAYTGAKKVDIVAHSMGVTLARKAILGGTAYDEGLGINYSVGPPLTASVDAFVGIAGANLGLTSCYLTGPTTPTCGAGSGLYPGYLYFGLVVGRSTYLNDLLNHPGTEGAYRYSMLSTVDEVIGYGDVVYGSYTSALPGQTAQFVYSTVPYGHIGLKDQTCARQLTLVRDHKG